MHRRCGDGSAGKPAASRQFKKARGIGGKLGTALQKAGNDVIAGDCSLANGGILQETGTTPVHPLSFVARAYGIAPEEST